MFKEIEDLLNETVESDGETGIDQTEPNPQTGKLHLIVLQRIYDRPIGTDHTRMVTCMTVLIHPCPRGGGPPKIATAYPTAENRALTPQYRYGPEGRAPIPRFDLEEEYFHVDITEDEHPETSTMNVRVLLRLHGQVLRAK